MTEYDKARTDQDASNVSSQNDAINQAIKALISLSSTAREADQVIRDFNERFDVEETATVLEQKYDYVLDLFEIDPKSRAAYDPHQAEREDKAASNYYSLLSVIILRKWR